MWRRIIEHLLVSSVERLRDADRDAAVLRAAPARPFMRCTHMS
jgi:hypothetical protein